MRKGSGRIRALLGAVVVVALLAGAQTSSGQTPGKRITLLIWSSTWNGVMKQLAEQFTKETGIGVDIEIQASSMEGSRQASGDARTADGRRLVHRRRRRPARGDDPGAARPDASRPDEQLARPDSRR